MRDPPDLPDLLPVAWDAQLDLGASGHYYEAVTALMRDELCRRFRRSPPVLVEAEVEMAIAKPNKRKVLSRLRIWRKCNANTVGDFNKLSSTQPGLLPLPLSGCQQCQDQSPSSRLALSPGSPSRLGTARKTTAGVMSKRMMRLYESVAKLPGFQIFADFYMWCVQKFGNLTRCWRALDASTTMRLTFFEFALNVKKQGFTGDAKTVFKTLDRDRSGNLSFYHFDPAGARELAKLCAWVEQRFGNLQSAFKALDKDRNGKLSMSELREGFIEYGFDSPEPTSCLFAMLDSDKNKKITLKELEFLDAWKCPPWLKCQEADHVGAQEFKRSLFKQFKDNPILAWHLGLDLNGCMRVSWEEFLIANEKLNLVPKSRLPSIWRAMDDNQSGWLSLREFVPKTYSLLITFKTWCVSNHGSIVKAMESLDDNENGVIVRKEFYPVIKKELNLSDEESEMLFEGFDVLGDGRVQANKLRFLDRWNVEEELREEEFWDIIANAFTRAGRSSPQADEDETDSGRPLRLSWGDDDGEEV